MAAREVTAEQDTTEAHTRIPGCVPKEREASWTAETCFRFELRGLVTGGAEL